MFIMAKKDITEIKKLLKMDKVIIGTEKTIKNLKLGKLSKIFLSENCPEDVKGDISRYAGLVDVKVTKLNLPNDELGVLCKKPFSTSVLGITK